MKDLAASEKRMNEDIKSIYVRSWLDEATDELQEHCSELLTALPSDLD